MNNFLLGYRLKFDNIDSENIEDFVVDYLEKFDIYEIKLTKNLLNSEKLELILNVSEKGAKGKYSIHIFKDVISNKKSFEYMVKFLDILRNRKFCDSVVLVTHTSYDECKNNVNEIIEISKLLPDRCMLLLENPEIDRDVEEYLKDMNRLFGRLNSDKIFNIGCCLDIGHLLFSGSKQGITEKHMLEILQSMSNIMCNIKEIHIHDYLDKDHIQIGNGKMNLKLVFEFLTRNNLIVPTIIETTVKVAEEDGIKQIAILKNSLNQLEENKI